jgi:hypothetical protein
MLRTPSSGPAASTAVSRLDAHGWNLLTCVDYNWYGNNVAEGQFREQVWGPVCHDPSVGEVKARQDITFD